MEKRRRQQKIASLIVAHRIGTQAELAARLERAGVVATQSSVSRDLEELGVVKHKGRYVMPQDSTNANARGLLSLEQAGDALIVARCETGLASGVALEIDRAMLDEIAGTLAGDDTVFIAVANATVRRAAMRKIWKLFG